MTTQKMLMKNIQMSKQHVVKSHPSPNPLGFNIFFSVIIPFLKCQSDKLHPDSSTGRLMIEPSLLPPSLSLVSLAISLAHNLHHFLLLCSRRCTLSSSSVVPFICLSQFGGGVGGGKVRKRERGPTMLLWTQQQEWRKKRFCVRDHGCTKSSETFMSQGECGQAGRQAADR